MAKLTLSFKGHHISIHHLEENPTTIGRDEDCGIRIDSLAVAPRHAELIPSENGYLMLGLDPDYPIQLNSERIDQASLHHGDMIQIGKHTLVFSEDTQGLVPTYPATTAEAEAEAETEAEAKSRTDEPEGAAEKTSTDSVTGYMQIQSGPLIGRVLVFRHAMTQLKRAGAEGVVITRNGDSYKLVRIEEQARIKIDGIPVEEEDVEFSLHHDNLIEIDSLRFRFFTETSDGKSP